MLRPGSAQVDPGGLNAAVAQHVGQLGHVPGGGVEAPGEEMPQVVGEDLGALHPRLAAEPFHLRPDVLPVQRPSAAGAEDHPGGNGPLPGVLFQPLAELPGQEDGPHLSLQGDLRPPPEGGLHGDVGQLGHPDAGGADGLQQQGQALLAQGQGGLHQTEVFPPGQLPPLVPEEFPLAAEGGRLAVPPPQKGEETVEGGQLPVDRADGVALGQGLLPGQDLFLGYGLPRVQSVEEGLCLSQILLHSGPAALPGLEGAAEGG